MMEEGLIGGHIESISIVDQITEMDVDNHDEAGRIDVTILENYGKLQFCNNFVSTYLVLVW